MKNRFAIYTDKCGKCRVFIPYEGAGPHAKLCKTCNSFVANHTPNVTCAFCKKGYRTFPSWHKRRGAGNANNWILSNRIACKRCFKMLTGKARTRVIRDYCPWYTVIAKTGRAYIRDKKNPSNSILRYRLMMECKLGRALDWDEVVHHVDGDHTNDTLENLELTNRSAHVKAHIREYKDRGQEWPAVAAMRERYAALRSERACRDCGRMFPACTRTQCMKCYSSERQRARYARNKARGVAQ